jgi:hypothetical protein
MLVEPACDTIPRPLAPVESVGGTIPTGVVPVAERGVLLGVVLEAGTGRVLQGSRVRLYRSGTDTGRVQARQEVWTNASGAFQLEPLPPAEYALTINRLGYAARTQHVTVHAGVVDTITIGLRYQSCVGY